MASDSSQVTTITTNLHWKNINLTYHYCASSQGMCYYYLEMLDTSEEKAQSKADSNNRKHNITALMQM